MKDLSTVNYPTDTVYFSCVSQLLDTTACYLCLTCVQSLTTFSTTGVTLSILVESSPTGDHGQESLAPQTGSSCKCVPEQRMWLPRSCTKVSDDASQKY